MRELNEIYIEINEYNDNYWNQYLFAVWITFGLTINFSFYLFLFCNTFYIKVISLIVFLLINYLLYIFISNNVFIIKIAFFVGVILFSLFLIFIIEISSALYIEANKTYVLLNSLLFSKNNISVKMHFKVCIEM